MNTAGWTMENGTLMRKDGLLFTAYDSLQAGLALGKIFKTVGTGCAESAAAKGLVMAAESGILQNRGTVWQFGECFESQAEYCVSRSGAECGIYVHYSGEVQLSVRGGLPFSKQQQEEFLQTMNACRERPVFWGDWGNVFSMKNLRELYRVELIKAAETTLSGMKVDVKCANPVIREIMQETLGSLGCQLREGGLTLQISADGKEVSAYENINEYLFTDRILCLVCFDLFRRGQDVAVSASAPRVLDETARSFGRKVFRYTDGFPGTDDRRARSLGIRQPFLRDGLMLGLRLLSIMRRNNATLAQLKKCIPGYAMIYRTVPVPYMEQIPASMILTFPTGELRLRSIQDGRAVFLAAEGKNMEAAAELCQFGEEQLQHGHLEALCNS